MKKNFLSALVVCGVVAISFVSGCQTQPRTGVNRGGLIGGRGVLPPAYLKADEYKHANDTAFRNVQPATDQNDEEIVIEDTPVFVEPETPQEMIEVPVAPVAPATPAAPVITASGNKTYTVQKGDTLSGIAVAYGVKWKTIAALNPDVNPDRLKIGTVLVMPDESLDAPAVKPAAPKSSVSSAPVKSSADKQVEKAPADGVYVVVSGDNLTKIAKKFGVKIRDLRAWNSLSSDNLQVGQKLVVVGTPVASPASSTLATAVATEKSDVAQQTPAQVTTENLTFESDENASDNTETLVVENPMVEETAVKNVIQQFNYTVLEGDTIDYLTELLDVSREHFLKYNPTIKSDADLVVGENITIFY